MLNFVPEIVDVAQFQRWNRSEQPTKLRCRVCAQLKFVPQANFFRPVAHEEAHTTILDPAAETAAYDAQRYSHFSPSSLLRPATGGVLLVDIRWPQM